MSNIADFLDEIERLAYKILLWVLLLPKTLLKIILEPKWVPRYVKAELSEDSSTAFDRFMSPVVLFLIVTLIPAILLSFVPTTGMTVSYPVPAFEDDLRYIDFGTTGKFISSTARVIHQVWWEVWKVDQVDGSGNPISIEYGYDELRNFIYVDDYFNAYPNPTFTFMYGELHDEIDGAIDFTMSGDEPKLANQQLYAAEISLKDRHTIEDHFYYYFDAGEYQVRVTIENHDPNNDAVIESWSDIIYVTVPEDVNEEIYFDSATMVFDDSAESASSTLSVESLLSSLESGGTYLIALGILALPLLFSFGTKILGEDGLGGSNLKHSFYMQCYYFSPLTAVFWSSMYALNLYTSDIYFIALIAPLVMFALIILWFWNAEISAIMIERGVSVGRAWGILSVLMVTLVGGSLLIYAVLQDPDFLRRYSIAFYPIIGTAVFVAYILKRRRERLQSKQKLEQIPEQPAQ